MKILLTRPIDDSIITSKILSQIGIETLIIPFLEIGRVNYQELRISQSDYIMFTSKNAANFLDLKNNLQTTQFSLLEVKQKRFYKKKVFKI